MKKINSFFLLIIGLSFTSCNYSLKRQDSLYENKFKYEMTYDTSIWRLEYPFGVDNTLVHDIGDEYHFQQIMYFDNKTNVLEMYQFLDVFTGEILYELTYNDSGEIVLEQGIPIMIFGDSKRSSGKNTRMFIYSATPPKSSSKLIFQRYIENEWITIGEKIVSKRGSLQVDFDDGFVIPLRIISELSFDEYDIRLDTIELDTLSQDYSVKSNRYKR